MVWRPVAAWEDALVAIGMVWYGMVCYVMVWYGMVWYGMVAAWEDALPTRVIGAT